VLGTAPSLELIYLRDLRLNDTLPAAWGGGLPRLRQLWLDGNDLSGECAGARVLRSRSAQPRRSCRLPPSAAVHPWPALQAPSPPNGPASLIWSRFMCALATSACAARCPRASASRQGRKGGRHCQLGLLPLLCGQPSSEHSEHMAGRQRLRHSWCVQ
jgi:hypothetical protein